jgi:hypothetical protein
MSEITQLENTSNEIDIDKKNKLINEFYIICKLIKTYIKNYKPIFNESFNELDPINTTEITYILEIPYIIISKIIRVLKLLHYKNKTYLSNDEKNITGLPYKSYAYYKVIYENGYRQYVFCLETDKNCNGILLSPDCLN